MESQTDWNKRGELGVFYNGEYFYTITPLPFYIKRRKVLLDLLTPYIVNASNICDLGCGDGWYIQYFQEKLNLIKKFVGIDASEVMLDRARSLNPSAHFYQSECGISQKQNYQTIYTIATLAHITDLRIQVILESVVSNLCNDGHYIIFEQVAPIRYSGDSFARRTVEEYLSLFEEYNLEVEKIILVRFRFHQLFERFFAKRYYQLFCRGESDYERRINANSHRVFRLMSEIVLWADRKVLWDDYKGKWGNIFVALRKKGDSRQ